MTGLIDPGALQLDAAWLSVVAALGGLVNLLVGLSSAVTGRGYWPKRLEHLRRRKPASEEDQRRRGTALALNGAAILIIMMGSSLNIFGARDHSQVEPLNTLRFVITLIGFAGAIACIAAAYGISLRVKYTYPRFPAEIPPAESTI
jgi:uncharacterized iron-regulated membrane protein